MIYRNYEGKTVSFNGQQEVIYKHLKKNGAITPLEALGVYSVYRLAARVYELRSKGVPVDTTYKQDATGKTYASYSIKPDWKKEVTV
jgi:hypothetical protein